MFTNVKNVQQSHTNIFYLIKRIIKVIALWYCLCLPSCGCGFESEAHQLHYFQFVLLKLLWEMDENKQKESGICPFYKKSSSRGCWFNAPFCWICPIQKFEDFVLKKKKTDIQICKNIQFCFIIPKIVLIEMRNFQKI